MSEAPKDSRVRFAPPYRRLSVALLLLPLLAISGSAGCGMDRSTTIVIGSKNFTEQAVL